MWTESLKCWNANGPELKEALFTPFSNSIYNL